MQDFIASAYYLGLFENRAPSKPPNHESRHIMITKQKLVPGLVCLILLTILLPAIASAHNVSARDATFVQANKGTAVGAFLHLGAKHMVTGYDHLLFLVGVIFFLYRFVRISSGVCEV